MHHEEPHIDLMERTVHYPEILDSELGSITTRDLGIVSFGVGMVGKMGTCGCLGSKGMDCGQSY